MNKQKWISVVSSVVVVGGAVLLVAVAPTKKTVNNSTASANQTSVNSNSSQYTLAQVAEHADANNCWSAVNGNIYDLTAWISPHPGGEDVILGMCGKDSSVAFNNQHGGSSRIARILENFKIGTLK